MKLFRVRKWMWLAAPGAMLLGFGGCLGPNPGFFIGTTAAGAVISNLVGAFIGNILE